MPAREQLFDDLADAALDGGTVDWAAVESSASPAARPLVRGLHLVASVARVHRQVLPAESVESRPAPGETALPGRWGHLRLLERIGRGSFGEVFRAWDTRLDREVALKLLSAAPSSDSDGERSIIQEGRLLARVRHPNVVTIYGAEQIGDRVGFWMELVRGRTLEQLLREGRVFREDEIVAIGLDLCRAVSAVHAAGLLHRDIKAQNVTRADDGRVVLMDFGTGKEFGDESSDLAGTPLYLAPEVLTGNPATVRSDIYSLGLLLYHLATGSYPVLGRTVPEVRHAHAQNQRVGLRSRRPGVGSALARVVERACAQEPERRYENVDVLARDLTALQQRPGIVRRKYRVAAAAAALVAALVAFTVWIAWEPSPAIAWEPSPAIVVLPFVNLGNESDGLLVDSITDGVIRRLQNVNGLTVTSRATSFMLKDKPRNLADIGTELGVNLVVEADARFSGGTLHMNAALVSVEDGKGVWSGYFRAPIGSEGDVGKLIDELTGEIVVRLRLRLGRTPPHYAIDVTTLTTHLMALDLRDRRGGASILEAIPRFEDVIRKDASFAPAQAALAVLYGRMAMMHPSRNRNSLPPLDAAELMQPLIRRALELEPELAEAHAAEGYLHAIARRWEAAERSFQEAIRLEPGSTSLYGDFVLSTLLPWGRIDDALLTMRTAISYDPLSPDVRRVIAEVQLIAGEYDDTLDNCRRVREGDPNITLATEGCTWALFFKGERAEALEQLEQFSKSGPGGPGSRPGVRGWIHAANGEEEKAHEIAALFDEFPQRQAEIYGLLGDKDRALEALERLAIINPMRAGFQLVRPEVGLKDDPRADEFRRKLGFPPR